MAERIPGINKENKRSGSACFRLHMETTTQTDWDAQDAAMDVLYEGTLANFTEGSIVTGRIIRVHDGDVTIDVGYKS